MMQYWRTEDALEDGPTLYSQHELEEACDEMLDEIYPTYSIAGVEFFPSRIVHTDGPLWAQIIGEFEEDFTACDVPWEIVSEGDDAVLAFIAANPSRWMPGTDA